MAESYFELLTKQQRDSKQQGLPAKSFSPLEELRLLRRKLNVRLQTPELPVEQFEIQEFAPSVPCESEPVSIEAVVEKVGEIEETLDLAHCPPAVSVIAPTLVQIENESRPLAKGPLAVAGRCLNVPQERLLSTLTIGLTALGIIGVVFGVLSFSRGWEGDLPLGSWVSASGAAIIALGVGGRFFATR